MAARSKYFPELRSKGRLALKFVSDDSYEFVNEKKVVVSNSTTIYDFIKPIYGDDINLKEQMFVILMSNNGTIVGYSKVSEGGIDFTGLDVKHVCITTLLANAVNVALVHNHPMSGTRPSKNDRELTNKVQKALGLFDIRLLDHLVVTDDSYYSFRDNGDI